MHKILFFASDYQIGLSSLLTDQLISLNKRNELTIIALAGENEQEKGLYNKLKENNINIKRIHGLDKHARFLKLAFSITKLIKSEKIEVIHVQNNWQLVLSAFIKYSCIVPKRYKIVYTLHGFRHNHYFKSVIAKFIIGLLLLLFANRIIYMSDYVGKNFYLLSYKMSKIFLGIDDSFFIKKDNHVEIESLKMVFPAQFRPGKNQDLIIRAFSEYIKKTNDNNAELHLPGSGGLKKGFQELAQNLNIENQVFFPGLLTKLEIRNLYEFCNIGIISSNTETFGQSIIEPFVLGRCILSRNVGVASEIIAEAKNGYIFENETDLENILMMLRNNKHILSEIGNNNFLNREIFSWENITKEYIKTISKLTKS